MNIYTWNGINADQQQALLSRPAMEDSRDIETAVAAIVENVRQNGDEAVKEYTSKFDQVDLESLQFDKAKIDLAENEISDKAKNAIDNAYENIKNFHVAQGLKSFEVVVKDGVVCERRVRPLNAVGLYIPGGTAPLVSTTLMCGVPAQIANCPNIVLSTPCNKDGIVDPHIIYAAKLCGVTQIFKIGGAQAIAAMAFGTQSVPKVDKIFGPGNAYVTAAKKVVSQSPEGASFDLPAGPSEVLVIADDTTKAKFAAADLLSQAEHDTMSQVILLTPSQKTAQKIVREVDKQLKKLSRKEIAEQAIKNSRVIVVSDLNQAIKVSNQYAPEHLILSFDTAEEYLDDVLAAGSVFVGHYACESAGDYCSGTNHVLPTYGYAKQYSGLGVEAFQKTITFQKISKSGLLEIADTIETLAEIEGLDGHARAVFIRR